MRRLLTKVLFYLGVVSKPELADKLAAFESREEIDPRTGAPRGRLLFPEHLAIDDLQMGLKTGKFKKGNFQVVKEDCFLAFRARRLSENSNKLTCLRFLGTITWKRASMWKTRSLHGSSKVY